jgi:hypothetical protein
MRLVIDDLTAAAFIFNGMKIPNYHEVVEAWQAGNIELVQASVIYAPYLNALGNVGFEFSGEYPGVFEYDVIETFGCWLAKTVLETGEMPSKPAARLKAVNLTCGFFEGEVSAELFCHLMDMKYEGEI